LREDFLIELVSASPQETLTLGRRISGSLVPGSVVALRGGLGSGKTCLVKGIADGLGIRETVTSPTYTIISEYPGSPTLYHIDAYRLESEQDFERIGGGEVISGSGISVIEWSERIQKSLPECAVVIELKITGSFSRLIRISGLEFA
jgi:tRNA threonylcarbamoyladenosine biosynthesis protein TsaE